MMTHSSTQLLVSVRSASEAEAALAGGADLIDVKEPARGALGRADDAVVADVIRAVAGRRQVSAAMGELRDREKLFAYASGSDQNLAFVKWGLAGCRPDWRGELENFAEEMRQANGPAVVAVAYADWELAQAPPVWELADFAVRRPGGVLLIDTWDKTGGRTLLDWLPRPELARLVKYCHSASARLALAGSLTTDAIQDLAELHPDWFAVRGAACAGNRSSPISATRVHRLVRLVHGEATASCGS